MDMIAFSAKPFNSGKALTGNLAEYCGCRDGRPEKHLQAGEEKALKANRRAAP